MYSGVTLSNEEDEFAKAEKAAEKCEDLLDFLVDEEEDKVALTDADKVLADGDVHEFLGGSFHDGDPLVELIERPIVDEASVEEDLAGEVTEKEAVTQACMEKTSVEEDLVEKPLVSEEVAEKEDVTQTVTKKFQFVLSDSDFERLVVESFAKLLNDEETMIKFPHTLTVKQREIIHEKALMNGLNSKSEGTRFRVLYLFKDNREVEKQTERQIVSSQLQEATNVPLPNSQEVADVISQPLTEMGSQSKIPCPVCGKLYAISQGLRTHMSRMHKNEFKEMKNTQ